MNAFDVLFAAGYLLLVGLLARAVCRHLPDSRAHRRAQVATDLARLRYLRHNPPIVDTQPGPPYSDLRLDAELIATGSHHLTAALRKEPQQ